MKIYLGDDRLPIKVEHGLKIEKEKINILGVWVHEDISEQTSLNYDEIIQKTQATFNDWKHRQLSLTGKVQIFNSLIASLYVYKMSVLANMPEKYVMLIEKMLEEFLWNGRRAKIPLKRLYALWQEGGYNLVNIRIKDESLKFSWVSYVMKNESCRAQMYESLGNYLQDDIWRCNLNTQDINTMFGTGFWQDVLKTWTKFQI